ncbi:unnamed protein product [Amoebophrya sp. A25]|nr:unnamed protein product [Amoebophrya sp. A25]|eukprot:GSA25T00020208001.1
MSEATEKKAEAAQQKDFLLGFECTFIDYRWFMRFMDGLGALFPIISINCTEEGWKSEFINERQTVLCDFALRKEYFEYYMCAKPLSLTFQPQMVYKALRCCRIEGDAEGKVEALRLHMRYNPTQSSGISFRVDAGLPTETATEFWIPQADDIPETGVVPHMGPMDRVQFTSKEFLRIMGDFKANGFDDTMQLEIRGNDGAVCFKGRGEHSTAHIAVQHDVSGKPNQRVYCKHVPTESEAILGSIDLLQRISKSGKIAPFWDMFIKEKKPMILPLYADSEFAHCFSSRGRDSSALRFFICGFNKKRSPQHGYDHLINKREPDFVAKPRPETKPRDVTKPVDPKLTFDLTGPVEEDPDYGVQLGELTFWLQGMKEEQDVIQQFAKMRGTPLARQRRERELRFERAAELITAHGGHAADLLLNGKRQRLN